MRLDMVHDPQKKRDNCKEKMTGVLSGECRGRGAHWEVSAFRGGEKDKLG